MQTPEEFISLAAKLRTAFSPVVEEAHVEIVEAVERAAPDEEDLVRDVRLFHARLAETLEDAVDTLLCDIAADVLARELQLAPADIERLVAAAVQRFQSEEPLRVRLHPDDCERVQIGVPVVADAALRLGDAVIELRSGCVDATLGVRLASVLRAVRE